MSTGRANSARNRPTMYHPVRREKIKAKLIQLEIK
jgi:hypothetical protein